MSELAVGSPFRLKSGIKAVSVRGDRYFIDRQVHVLGHCQHLTEYDEEVGQLWVYPSCEGNWGCSMRLEDIEPATPDQTSELCPQCFASST